MFHESRASATEKTKFEKNDAFLLSTYAWNTVQGTNGQQSHPACRLNTSVTVIVCVPRALCVPHDEWVRGCELWADWICHYYRFILLYYFFLSFSFLLWIYIDSAGGRCRCVYVWHNHSFLIWKNSISFRTMLEQDGTEFFLFFLSFFYSLYAHMYSCGVVVWYWLCQSISIIVIILIIEFNVFFSSVRCCHSRSRNLIDWIRSGLSDWGGAEIRALASVHREHQPPPTQRSIAKLLPQQLAKYFYGEIYCILCCLTHIYRDTHVRIRESGASASRTHTHTPISCVLAASKAERTNVNRFHGLWQVYKRE